MGGKIVLRNTGEKEYEMINKQKALDDFQISEKEYDELLVEFVSQADDKIISIKQCLSDGKVLEAEHHTHSLKGVAGNLRLDDCYRIASTIDDVLKKNQQVSIDQYILELKHSIDEVRSSINTLT
jgi:HPt (histidine-containing phosphotransfer) domain-containing protein